MVTYGLEGDMLPLAELALHHDDVIAELTEHCVEAICFGSPSFHPGLVSSRGMVHVLVHILSDSEVYSLVRTSFSFHADEPATAKYIL